MQRVVIVLILDCIAASANAAPATQPSGPIEFPPGTFSDRLRHQVVDCRGKLLVLCFFDPEAPRAWDDPTSTQMLIDGMSGRPVRFIAILPGMTLTQQRITPLSDMGIPTFGDPLRLTQQRAGPAGGQNVQWTYTLIGRDGNIIGSRGEDLAHLVPDLNAEIENVHWRYRGREVPHELAAADDLLEWNRLAEGMALVRPWLKSADVVPNATALSMDHKVRADVAAMRSAADAEEREDPIAAYEADAIAAATFPDEPEGRDALRTVHRLVTQPAVRDELAARVMWRELDAASESAEKIVAICQKIIARYPTTPTAGQAKHLTDEIHALRAEPKIEPAREPEFRVTIAFRGWQSNRIQLTADEIIVGWPGAPSKELYRAKLSAAQAQQLRGAVQQITQQKLSSRYVDERVNDGFQCSFAFERAGRPQREIEISNMFPAEVVRFCDAVDTLLPDAVKIKMPRALR